MRSMVSILSRLVVAGMLAFSSASVVLGQDHAEALKREWVTASKGRTEFEVSDAALIPSTLALAAEQSGCRYKDDIKDAPVRFIRPEGRRLAIVFCSGIAVGSHQVFDVRNVLKPTLVELPFLAQPDGFGTTARPGWITWEKEANIFQAETGSDISFARLRHIYRVDRGTGSFVIVRIEFTPHIGTKDEWTTIWDAPNWSFPAKPN
ncbi:hypothetical protein [Bradyrhizobium sp. sGM-13]|uniref:hypothetical protein n=1 Tax=Bradyrhizobium sp. sGM-13 TaxID=2831781 RepID=UPI001BCE5913|nr:hypothetical protein [Bradyrhizobium sp. sGM-13]